MPAAGKIACPTRILNKNLLDKAGALSYSPQLTVLDAGGQYCHLIARQIRDLGVFAEVRPSDTPASELRGRKGLIISGGPDSVYESDSARIDPAILAQDNAVLGFFFFKQKTAY